LKKKLSVIRWKEKDWIPTFVGMTEGGGDDMREEGNIF